MQFGSLEVRFDLPFLFLFEWYVWSSNFWVIYRSRTKRWHGMFQHTDKIPIDIVQNSHRWNYCIQEKYIWKPVQNVCFSPEKNVQNKSIQKHKDENKMVVFARNIYMGKYLSEVGYQLIKWTLESSIRSSIW